MRYFSIQLQSLVYIYIYIYMVYIYIHTPYCHNWGHLFIQTLQQSWTAAPSRTRWPLVPIPPWVVLWCQESVGETQDEQKKVSGLMVVPTIPWGHLFRFAFVWLIWCFFWGFRNDFFQKSWLSVEQLRMFFWLGQTDNSGEFGGGLFLASFSGEVSCRKKDQEAQELGSMLIMFIMFIMFIGVYLISWVIPFKIDELWAHLDQMPCFCWTGMGKGAAGNGNEALSSATKLSRMCWPPVWSVQRWNMGY